MTDEQGQFAYLSEDGRAWLSASETRHRRTWPTVELHQLKAISPDRVQGLIAIRRPGDRNQLRGQISPFSEF